MTLAKWTLFFFIYCFLGWCIESTIVSVETRKLTNRGFLQGPVLPIYGFGAVMILYCTLPFEGHIVLQYIVGVISCTALEYVTGVLMEAIFKTKYWDYSNKFMNFQGRICLVSSLFWGVLTLFVIYVIHEPLSAFVNDHMNAAVIVTLDAICAAAMLSDLYFSAKAAFTLTKIARILDEANVQLELAKMEARDALVERAEEISDRIESRIEDVSEKITRRTAELHRIKEEALRELGFAARGLIRNNPSARHKLFADGYNELKEHLRKEYLHKKE